MKRSTSLLDVEKAISDRLPQMESRVTLRELVGHFVELSDEEQKAALGLFEKLGIAKKPFLMAKEKQQENAKKASVQNSIKTVFTKMLSGQDDAFTELVGKRVFEMSGHQLAMAEIREFLSPSGRLADTTHGKFVGVITRGGAEKTQSQDGKIYTYRIPTHGIEAQMIIRGGSYIVLAGSTASAIIKDSMAAGHRRKRQELISSGHLVREGKSDLYVFKSDVVFDSPSAASGVISGSSTNGLKCFGIPN